MSNDDLLELWHLPDEIAFLQSEIDRISVESIPTGTQPLITELLETLAKRLVRCQSEYNRCIEFIQSIPIEWIRKACILRYLKCKSWMAVAAEMGLTPDCCRQMVHRSIKAATKTSDEKCRAKTKETAK